MLPEIKERIIDAKNSLAKHNQDKEMLKEILLQKTGIQPASSSSKSATTAETGAQPSGDSPKTDINHLVKRKRPASNQVESAEKKVHLEA